MPLPVPAPVPAPAPGVGSVSDPIAIMRKRPGTPAPGAQAGKPAPHRSPWSPSRPTARPARTLGVGRPFPRIL